MFCVLFFFFSEIKGGRAKEERKETVLPSTITYSKLIKATAYNKVLFCLNLSIDKLGFCRDLYPKMASI